MIQYQNSTTQVNHYWEQDHQGASPSPFIIPDDTLLFLTQDDKKSGRHSASDNLLLIFRCKRHNNYA